jgi:hypothetical protein
VLIAALSWAVSTAIVVYLWEEWRIFAFWFSAIYVIGGVRYFPWKTANRKAISIGIFLGIVISGCYYLAKTHFFG